MQDYIFMTWNVTHCLIQGIIQLEEIAVSLGKDAGFPEMNVTNCILPAFHHSHGQHREDVEGQVLPRKCWPHELGMPVEHNHSKR